SLYSADHSPTEIYTLSLHDALPISWDLNMNGLIHVLDAAVEFGIEKVYWPSSIAVFGPNTPKVNTPQDTIMDPTTIYGISKLARSEEHTSELQSRENLVCRLLLEKK